MQRSGGAWRRWLLRAGIGAIAVFAGIQLVPYGWEHSNPPVVQDAPWPDAESERIARASCYSCHSNETDWPVYSYVAPMSWLVRRDVEAGRDELNFSDWPDDAGEADDAIETIEEGSMPPRRYTLIHRDAELTDAEARTLVEALAAMEESDDRSGSSSGPG
jgi:hypothetical protein